MCVQHFLLADRRLPEVLNDPELPDLSIREVQTDAEQVAAIRRIADAPFVYLIGPSELCGCYFTYDAQSHHSWIAGADGNSPLSGEELRVADWLFRQGRNSVLSFRRYLERHLPDACLALYVCWERDEGKRLEYQETVSPSFFGGEQFERLVENAVYTIRPEPAEPLDSRSA